MYLVSILTQYEQRHKVENNGHYHITFPEQVSGAVENQNTFAEINWKCQGFESDRFPTIVFPKELP